MQKDALNEQLSALADDELRRDEALFLTRRLSQSPEAVEQLSRYFLISDALRKQLPETIDLGPAVAVTPVSVSDSQWERLDPEVQRRLNLYLVNHSEHSSAGQWGGVLNYVRITGHSDRD